MRAFESPGKVQILIVEDELAGAAYIKSIVDELGFQVLGIASTVETALEIIQSERKIDCATLDVRLGESLSSPIASALIAKEIPFVVCSAYTIVLRDFPRIPIVTKPFTARELADALNQAMGIAP
jgi:CheY-like chemotaxis protein